MLKFSGDHVDKAHPRMLDLPARESFMSMALGLHRWSGMSLHHAKPSTLQINKWIKAEGGMDIKHHSIRGREVHELPWFSRRNSTERQSPVCFTSGLGCDGKENSNKPVKENSRPYHQSWLAKGMPAIVIQYKWGWWKNAKPRVKLSLEPWHCEHQVTTTTWKWVMAALGT